MNIESAAAAVHPAARTGTVVILSGLPENISHLVFWPEDNELTYKVPLDHIITFIMTDSSGFSHTTCCC